jgi:hypothetical protein
MALGDTPWKVADAQRLLVRLGLGLAAIVVAWIGASGTITWRNQVIWTAVGAGGVLISTMAGAGWLLPAFSAIKVEQRALKDEIRALTVRRVTQIESDGGTPETTLLWAPGMSRYHRPSCPVVDGKLVQTISQSECRQRELLPCGMCLS